MMMTNGFGAIFGSSVSGYLIDRFFTLKITKVDSLLKYLKTDINNPVVKNLLKSNEIMVDNSFKKPIYFKEWSSIWLTFAIYALIIGIAFAFMFKHKHNPQDVETIAH
jgi:hypothetical protein